MTIDRAEAVKAAELIRSARPVIHNITNYVAMNLSANALLAVGASPIMSSEPLEIDDLSLVSSALVINIGCVEEAQVKAMEMAALRADEQSKPWVLDPVGVGASRYRLETATRLIEKYHPTVIRANASEILALAGAKDGSRGVDTGIDSRYAVEAAKELATKYRTVVSISGPTDYITDGVKVIEVEGGSPLMPMVTAMGCTATAITAAFLAVEPDALTAASGAMAVMAEAGERAAEKSDGPGTFAVRFIDALATLR